MKTKKLLCIIISLIVYVNTFPLCSSATNQEINVYEYNKLIRKLTDAYIPDNYVSTEEITEYPLNRLIVKTTSNNPLDNDYGAADKIEGYNCLHILQYETEEETSEAYKKLIQSDIEYVEYDYWLTAMDARKACYCDDNISNSYMCACTGYAFCPCKDPDAIGNHYSWSSSAVQVDEAFQLINELGVSCQQTKVAILDSGVYAAHEEFSKSENTVNRIKTDPNYVYVKNSVEYPSNEDDYFHGTHVAGIVHNNTMENVEIYSYRMSGKTLSPLSCLELTSAIDAAVANKVDVINMSLRREEFFNPNQNKTLETSIKNAIDENVVLVAGAGNSSDDAGNFIPAKYNNVITVSATTKTNVPDKSYSSYGDCVDISAPGTDIRSTSPRNDKNEEPENWMIRASGTSMATPLVSAAAATLKSIYPDITPAEVKRIIKETAYVPENWEESCDGKNYGTGIVNFYNMVKAVLEPEYSATPIIKVNSDNKFEIVAPHGTDARFYYTIDGSVPTIDNHMKYTEPFKLINSYNEKLIAVCHENGKLIGEPVSYDLITEKTKTIFYKWSANPLHNEDSKMLNCKINNPRVAAVDNEGNITGLSPGDTKITYYMASGKRVVCDVKVIYAPWQWIIRILFLGFLWY